MAGSYSVFVDWNNDEEIAALEKAEKADSSKDGVGSPTNIPVSKGA
tara:strand:+ start:476 stop:613 length:138 start_codon:yes stop_codon:yes gene_type:complete